MIWGQRVIRAAFAETPSHCRIIRTYASVEPINLSRTYLRQT